MAITINTLIFFLTFLGAGSFFFKIFHNDYIKNYSNIFELISIRIIVGFIFVSFFLVLINFFLPINKTISLSIIIFFIFFTLINPKDKNNILYVFLYGISLIILAFALLSYSKLYEDSYLYHLAFSKTLSENKIIIGLNNLSYRFGHISIFQYLEILENSLFLKNNLMTTVKTIYFSSIFIFFINKIIFEKNILLRFFSIFIFLFICIRFNRFGDFGNDVTTHLTFFLLTYFFIEFEVKKNNYNDYFSIISLLTIFCFFQKTFFILSFLLLFYLLCKNFKKIIFLKGINIFLVTFFIIFLSKNFLNTSCFVFPIYFTCFDYLNSFSDINLIEGVKEFSVYQEAFVKGWSKSILRMPHIEYLQDFNWFNTWYNHHFPVVIKKLLPFFFVIIFFTLLDKLISKTKNEGIVNYNKILITIIIFNLIFSIIWFFKFPTFRYGSSFLIMIFFPIFYFINKNIIFNNKKLFLILTVGLMIFFGKNLNRIIKDNNLLSFYPSYQLNNINQLSERKINNLNIYLGAGIINCGFISLCTDSVEFFKEIKVEEKFSYLIFYR